jgi:hypothetical protein
MPYADPERRKAYDRARNVTEARRAYMRAWAPKGRHHAIRVPGVFARSKSKLPGARSWVAELSEARVRQIRWAVIESGETIADTARAFGVSYGYAWAIVRRRRR